MMNPNTSILELSNLSSEVMSLVSRYKLSNLDTTIAELEKNHDVDGPFFMELFGLFVQKDIKNVEQLKVFSPQTILEYLTRTHQYYLDAKLPQMENLTQELAKTFDESKARVLEFFFLKFSTELKKHIEYEDNVVFPYIKNLLQAKIPDSHRNAFRLVRFEHFHSHDIEDQLGEFVEHLKTTFSDLSENLAFRHFEQHAISFEKDLRIHAKIEDEVLIPYAKELEKTLLESVA
jgi:regulator of cell morphogenesis and NO signaling